MKWVTAGIVLAGAVEMAGCHRRAVMPSPAAPQSTANASGIASYHNVAPADAKHFELTSMQSFIAPEVRVNPPPEYPVWLVDKHLPPMEITAQLAVNGQGHVYNVVVPGEGTAAPERRAFIAAIRKATLGWVFEPFGIVQWRELPDGSRRIANTQHPAFSQYYVFRFEIIDGRPSSGVSAVGAGGG